jgi:hypothetical protein
MIANIASDDALILPYRANPAGLNFRERQGNDVLQKFMRSGIAGAIARHTDPSGLQIHVGTTRVFPGRN